MRKPRITFSGVALGAIATLVLSGGTAYAATGGTFVLGKTNSATTTTALTNTKGTALKLTSKSGTAPLTVGNATRVPNLNADRLDDLHATSFALTTGATGNVSAESMWLDLDGDGTSESLAAVAECPAGTKLTGGGTDNVTTGATLVSSPDANAWISAAVADPAADAPADLVSYAVCYNPRGRIAGGQTNGFAATKAADVPADVKERLARAVAKRK